MTPIALLAIPGIPAAMALSLALFGFRLPYNILGILATLSVASSFALALGFIPSDVLGMGAPVTLEMGPWISTVGFQAAFRLRLDSVALCMVLLVTFFGSVITAYSIGYMRDDREQSRFFASLNLFVAAMLTLVLSDNLVLIFLGWEGVGLCSYLLIGHYWDQPGVPLAAFRAFFLNRIGDLFFILGVFMAFAAFGTISLSELNAHGPELISGHEWTASLAAILLLGGAFAKSAQAPLHVWLADAMAGPTPVSALIHAATMVTAGVYLIMRLDWLYAVVPQARFIIGVCALITLIVGALMALTQTDIKKILAYSTLSNLALMFLALAAGSSNAAMLHLFGHAFFKALLFLAAGSVILAAHHEQDVRQLQGILKTLPITRIAFWVGCLGGAGLIPYLSAGFFTKEAVLESLGGAQLNGFGLHLSGGVLHSIVLGVESLSVLYLFRLLGYLSSNNRESAYAHAEHSHSQESHGVPREKSRAMRFVLGILIIAAPTFAWFSSGATLREWIQGGPIKMESMHWLHILPSLFVNLLMAAACFAVFTSSRRREKLLSKISGLKWGGVGPLDRKFYFDDAYAYLLVLPLKSIAWFFRLVLENIFIGFLKVFGLVGQGLSYALKMLQTGRLQQYAAIILAAVALAAFYLLRG